MTVAIVGGSGFIGSHLIDQLLSADFEVTDFDIMPPPNLAARHVYLDMLDPSKTVIALAGEYEALYMLAAMANVGDVYRSPTQAVETNVLGTVNVLEAARRHDIPRFILASTVWVYGTAPDHLCTEDSPLLAQKVDHVYTATKIAAELLTYSYAKLYGIHYTVLRYGIPYGPRARSGTVMAEFVKRALNGKPMVIQGDGKQKRRFVYVEDLAQANVLALSEKATNKTYNVDGPEEITVLEIAQSINDLLGPVQIQFEPARSGDYALHVASTERIEQDLGWRPKTAFKDGLAKYVKWYQSRFVKPRV